MSSCDRCDGRTCAIPDDEERARIRAAFVARRRPTAEMARDYEEWRQEQLDR